MYGSADEVLICGDALELAPAGGFAVGIHASFRHYQRTLVLLHAIEGPGAKDWWFGVEASDVIERAAVLKGVGLDFFQMLRQDDCTQFGTPGEGSFLYLNNGGGQGDGVLQVAALECASFDDFQAFGEIYVREVTALEGSPMCSYLATL